MGYFTYVVIGVLCSVLLSDALVTDVGCGILKSCQSFASNRLVTWAMSDAPDSIDIELRSDLLPPGPAYLAVAFGTSNKMMDADMYFCTSSDGNLHSGVITAQYGRPTELPLEDGLGEVNISVVDGALHCKFTRPMSVAKTISSDEHNFNLSSTEYHLLLAQGKLDAGFLAYHDWRSVTSGKFDFVANFAAEEALKNIPTVKPPQVSTQSKPDTTATEETNTTPEVVTTASTPAPEVTTKIPETEGTTTEEITITPQTTTTSGGMSSIVVSSWLILLICTSLTQLPTHWI